MCRDRKLFFLQTVIFPLIFLLGIKPRALGMLCVSLLLSYTPRPANRRAFVCLLEQNCSELNLHLVTIAHNNWRLQVTKCPHEYRKKKNDGLVWGKYAQSRLQT